MQLLIPDSTADRVRLFHLASAVLFGKNRPSVNDAPITTAWFDTAQGRLTRLLSGEFEGLLKEVSPSPALFTRRNPRSLKEEKKAKVARSIEHVRDGNLSKAQAFLGSGGMRDLNDTEIQDEFAKLLSPHS